MSSGGFEKRGAFLDLDGVIRHNNTSKKDGCYYCLSYSDVEYRDGAFDSIKLLYNAGYEIFFVTMQNCIKEGLVRSGTVKDIIQTMADRIFLETSALVSGWEICVSEEETDELKADAKFTAIVDLAVNHDINLALSIGVGDRHHDIFAYEKAGIGKKLQILNEFGDGECDLCDATEDLYGGLLGLLGCFDSIDEFVIYNYETVHKVWGAEYWIVNSKDGNYCTKILTVNYGHKCSMHYHKNKHETFTVLSGVLAIEYDTEINLYYTGDSVVIKPNTYHRFWNPIEHPCWFLETSTYHEDSDTYRLDESK